MLFFVLMCHYRTSVKVVYIKFAAVDYNFLHSGASGSQKLGPLWATKYRGKTPVAVSHHPTPSYQLYPRILAYEELGANLWVRQNDGDHDPARPTIANVPYRHALRSETDRCSVQNTTRGRSVYDCVTTDCWPSRLTRIKSGWHRLLSLLKHSSMSLLTSSLRRFSHSHEQHCERSGVDL